MKTGDKANETGAIILLTVVVIVMLVFNGRDTDGRLQGGHAVHRVGYRLFGAVDGCVAERAPRFQAIFALNLLTGWTFIGWVAALIWAMVDEPKLTK